MTGVNWRRISNPYCIIPKAMILNVYKPKGWTSNDVVQKIKHSCAFNKVGHAGTLDPLAEGVLLILTDADTKRQDEFMGLHKEYVVKLALGLVSDSDDLGTPTRPGDLEIASKITREKVATVLAKYIGKFDQQVPAYSAVKQQGQKLYSRARNKEEFDLPTKQVELFNLELMDFREAENVGGFVCPTAELKINCGKGFYVRSLVRDIGRDLGCGAVVTGLVRTKIGQYSSDASLSVDQVLLKHLKP